MPLPSGASTHSSSHGRKPSEVSAGYRVRLTGLWAPLAYFPALVLGPSPPVRPALRNTRKKSNGIPGTPLLLTSDAQLVISPNGRLHRTMPTTLPPITLWPVAVMGSHVTNSEKYLVFAYFTPWDRYNNLPFGLVPSLYYNGSV